MKNENLSSSDFHAIAKREVQARIDLLDMIITSVKRGQGEDALAYANAYRALTGEE